jgi:hypothetical protein
VGFALCAALAFVGLFVLDGAVAGAICLAAILALVGACVYALRGEQPEDVTRNARTGFIGWWWF